MGKTRADGADAQVVIAFESTYGTAVDGSGGGVYTKVAFKSSDIGGEKALGTDPLLGKGRDAQDPYYEGEKVDGSIVVPIDLRDFGLWLKGLFGAPTTTGASAPYTHAYESGGVLPSLDLETGHPQLGATGLFDLCTGVKLGTLAFDLSRNGPASASISAIAQGESRDNASSVDATPLENALNRFNQSGGAIKVGGVQLGSVVGGRFNFTNGLSPVETIRSDGLIDGVDEGEANCDGSITVRFSTDTTLSDAINAETPVALEYVYTMSGGYSLKFEMPRVFLPKKKRAVNGPGGIEIPYDFKASFDSTAGYMVKVTLINDVASY